MKKTLRVTCAGVTTVALLACGVAYADVEPARPSIKASGSSSASRKQSVELPILAESEEAEDTVPAEPAVVKAPPAPRLAAPAPSPKSGGATVKTAATASPAPKPAPKPAAASAPRVTAPSSPAVRQADAGAVRSYREKASEAASLGRWAEAEDLLRQAIRLDPQNADVVIELANALLEQGKEEPMLAVLLAYQGDDVRVTQMLGEGYVVAGRLKEAEQVFMDLSLRQPAEPYHRYNLGLVEYRMGKLEMAENAYLRAVELDPRFSDAQYNLALLYIRNKDYPKALTHLEEAVRLKEDPDYLINQGVVLRELNRFPASQAALEHALSLDPVNTLALNNLGITHFLAGNSGDAKKTFTKVLEIAPDDATAKSFLAKIATEPPRRESAPSKAVEAKLPAKTPAVSTAATEPPVKKTDAPASREVSSDLQRLQKENKELKQRLDEIEDRMGAMKQNVYKQIETVDRQDDQRINTALKKAQDVLEKKEKDLTKKMDRGSGSEAAIPASGDEALDARIRELQETLSEARSELDDVRRSRGQVGFSAEPGSTEDRLNAADQAVQNLQRQMRQLSIERDMLRSEIEAMRAGTAVSMSPKEGGRANINIADLNALLMIPGMEERLAHNIMWYRQNIGPFRSASDLKKVPGMDDAHYSQMIDHVGVGSAAGR